MIEWKLGGWAGSVNKWVRREVRQQLRENAATRRAQYGFLHRILRSFFLIGTFARFIVLYVLVNAVFVVTEALIAAFAPDWLPTWITSRPTLEHKTLLLNVSSYLITAQVGVLGVISLALALVTLIAQRESSSTDINIYYHESLAFEVVASCIALLAVLCIQLVWPAQFVLNRIGLGTDLLLFKMGLLAVHLGWLLMNLAGLAHFITTTFGFVQQSARELLRERYTANVVQPREITTRLRQHLYSMATKELSNDNERPSATFGFDFGDPHTIEIATTFAKPVVLYDVRMRWVLWVLRRWAARCSKAVVDGPRTASYSNHQGPMIWFTLNMDVRVRGRVGWCRRRGGVDLNFVEKFVIRRAFRFRRTHDDA